MKQPVKNLCTKKITEFTTDDTIYIQVMEGDMSRTYLCKFIEYDPRNASVIGEIIDVTEDYMKDKIGKQIRAKLHNCGLFGNAVENSDRAYYRWFDSSLYAMHPLEEHKITENGLTIPKHPSYGIARFSRVNHSGRVPLFGSSIQHGNTITLTISKASHERDLSHDWYHTRDEMIEIEMSNNQFGELISSFNYGSGVPVTIKRLNHERMPDPPFLSKIDLFKGEFKNQMHNYAIDVQSGFEAAMDILKNKPNIGKGDREVIISAFEKVISKLKSSLPFINNSFHDAMDKAVVEAKGEIEAHFERYIREKGLEAIGAVAPKLENDKSNTDEHN